MKFQDYIYTRPDVDAVLADIRHTVEVMENAASAEAQLAAFHDHEENCPAFRRRCLDPPSARSWKRH